MKTLMKTEWQKCLKLKVTKYCFIALALIMIGMIVVEFEDVQTFKENSAYQEEVLSWKEREENLIKYATESLEEDPWYSEFEKDQISRRIEIAKFRLEHNIEKDVYKNVWWFFNDKAFGVISTIVIIMTILIGSANIAGEYSTHTLRQVLLLPYKRWKILFSKFIVMLLVGVTLYGVMFVMGLGSGFLLHGFNGLTSQVVLYFGKTLTTMNMSLYSLSIVLLKLIELAFYASFVLLVSVWTKNIAATTVMTSAFAIGSVSVGNFLASYYSAINYLPFMNLDFRRYLDFGTTMPTLEVFSGNVVVEGITPLLSIGIVSTTIVVFIIVSFNIFKRQDM